MKFISLLSTVWLVLASLAIAEPSDREEAIAFKKVAKLQQQYQKNIHKIIKQRTTGCTNKKLLRRQECLPPRQLHLNNTFIRIPGARSRYDDFVGVQVLQTHFVHNDGLFLPFHRQSIALYEKALRGECGYADWSLSYKRYPQGQPSLTGPLCITLPGGGALNFPPATGGGCVYSGPFTPDKFKIYLGPTGLTPKGPLDGLGYNPRCLSRDSSLQYSLYARPTNASGLIDGSEDLAAFNKALDTSPKGLHGAGYFMMGLVAMDVFTCSNDPAFWLHHAQVDRMWAIWQGQDLEGRMRQVWGTQTQGNVPPSANVTLETQINFGVVSAPKTVGEVVSTVDGDLC
ncbi:hypothetical protein B0H66DRAFT_580153 [Apodospora peruviana]|uniref:Tyrosinase copper-binding domain-containing protein n=1 Tax=Apodospora peruviana TaxID=516989 RepID=A0AAE0MG27_9PEZI|nr:hypothetical protein B0H66DRAFT_580153 [Apodospora peruviana]